MKKHIALVSALYCLLHAPAAVAADLKPLNTFGYKLLEVLGKGDKNVVVSPLSIYEALSMAREGASGNTLKQMDELMGQVDSKSVVALNESLNKDKKVDVANAIYIKKGFAVKPSYLSAVKIFGESSELPFDEASRQHINGWVENKTRGRIKNLVEKLSPADRMVLVNAIYFKDKWQSPFKNAATHDDTFGSAKWPVKMMSQSSSYEYSENSLCQAIKMPYLSSIVMTVYLPRKGSADALVAAAKAGKLPTNYKRQEVNLSLPKFQLDARTDLIDPLKALGMVDAFMGNANFSRMSDTGLFISKAIHKAFLKVDEEGTEAAAATAIIMAETAARFNPDKPVEMRVDRPFFMTLTDTRSGADIFACLIKDPR